jgi:hypothetical protein
VGAELLVHAIVCAFAEQMKVVARQGRRKAVGILDVLDRPFAVGHPEAVGAEREPSERPFPKACGMNAAKRACRLTVVTRYDGNVSSLRQERPYGDRGVGVRMRTQHRKWITMRTNDESIDRTGRKPHVFIVPGPNDSSRAAVHDVSVVTVRQVEQHGRPSGGPRSSAGFAGATDSMGEGLGGAVEALSH